MAWTVLYCPMVEQTSWGVGSVPGGVPTVITFGAVFDANNNPVVDANGNALQIVATAALVATARQPSDYWAALQSSFENQLAALPGYATGTTYFRIDLPVA